MESLAALGCLWGLLAPQSVEKYMPASILSTVECQNRSRWHPLSAQNACGRAYLNILDDFSVSKRTKMHAGMHFEAFRPSDCRLAEGSSQGSSQLAIDNCQLAAT